MSLLVAGARGCEGIHEVMSPPSVTTDASICTGSRHSHAGGDDSVIETHTHTHTCCPPYHPSQPAREREKDGVSPATGHVRTLSHFHSLLSSTNLSLVQCIFYTSNHQFKFDHITRTSINIWDCTYPRSSVGVGYSRGGGWGVSSNSLGLIYPPTFSMIVSTATLINPGRLLPERKGGREVKEIDG